eukprot:CAMPEP_0170544796 /NCGR_PEP_ID=MMETSP0211-20121228/3426_1 /TAXON_ID=311385 /ORGANISM="Pseudokeronopsis sp., Strain OXSARD2" /LENGTH=194 /DNA_ID=CAMNT_0010848535 /DNA_START=83 /DNA_END=667 /DNA_ORIENTATION=+
MNISERTFSGGYFVYFNYQGNVKSVGTQYEKLMEDLGKFTSKKLTCGTDYQCLGIYYDSPDNLINPDHMRTSLGYLLPSKDDLVINHFEKLKYKTKQIPSAKSIYGRFRNRINGISHGLGAYKFYPASTRYLHSQQKKPDVPQNSANMCASLELEGSSGFIEYYIPCEYTELFYLTEHPVPQLRNPNCGKQKSQ